MPYQTDEELERQQYCTVEEALEHIQSADNCSRDDASVQLWKAVGQRGPRGLAAKWGPRPPDCPNYQSPEFFDSSLPWTLGSDWWSKADILPDNGGTVVETYRDGRKKVEIRRQLLILRSKLNELFPAPGTGGRSLSKPSDIYAEGDSTQDKVVSINATVAAERACRRDLAALMRTGPPSKTKVKYREDFKIAERAFLRAWGNALTDVGPELAAPWSKPGRKS